MNKETPMKIKSLFVAVLLLGGVLVAPAQASQKPIVESFTFSPQDIDLVGASTVVSFELVVSHPAGIAATSTLLTLKNSRNDTLVTSLTRTDSNTAAAKVTFTGSLTVPRNIEPGVYTFTAASLKNNSSAGYQYETGTIEGGNVRALVGAEGALLVRSGGELNFDYATFVGPAYNATLGILYNNPSKFNSSNVPIWKVGESYDPAKYFELRVPSLSLALTSSTPTVCSTDGKSLLFVKEGICSFVVSTAKTKDYLAKTSSQSATITAARIKPTLTLEKIANQDVKDLGKSIALGQVYTVSEGYVLPLSPTPTVCFADGFYVKLIAGGTCKLTYQTAATSTYLASDLYTVSFEILKDGQPVVAPAPVVTPTPTPKPVVKKTITCTKGKKSVKRTGVSPKCPKGFKLKR
jgi:hypothetical protein